MKSEKRKTIWMASVIGVWLVAVVVGACLMLRYETTAGSSGLAPAAWPSESQISRRTAMPTLVMMVHPRCACSRASVGELAQLMAQAADRVDAHVLFIKPAGLDQNWEKSDLWDSATAIPGVNVSIDPEGFEARRFGSQTSGQVMLYSAEGQLLFAGGITQSRGHAGDNDGRTAIVSLLTEGGSSLHETPVFGCSLFQVPAKDVSKEWCNAPARN